MCDPLKETWIAVDVIQKLLSDAHATVFFWSKFNHFGTNIAITRFMPKIAEKIAWHVPTDMPTSSETSLIVIRLDSTSISSLDQHFHRLMMPWGVQDKRRHSHLFDVL